MKTTYKMIIFPVVLFWLLFPTWAQAAQISAGSPRLVLTSYATEPEQVYAGESFDLRLRLQNNGDGSLCNVTLSVGNAENNYFIAAENLTVLITELPAGEEKEAVFHLEVQPEAPAQPLSLSLEIAGENALGQSWQTEESVTIPVRQRLRLQAGDPVWDPESLRVGDRGYGQVELINKGKSAVYNIELSLESNCLRLLESGYVGSLAAGYVYTAVLPVEAIAAGVDEGTIVVAYEDAYGETYSQNLAVQMSVAPAGGETADAASASAAGLWITTAILAVVLSGTLWLIRRGRHEK